MDHWLSAPFDLSKCSPGVRGRQAVHAVASGRRGAERDNGGVSPHLMPSQVRMAGASTPSGSAPPSGRLNLLLPGMPEALSSGCLSAAARLGC
jgi:hypothetical protein